jgi:hypothetical protein
MGPFLISSAFGFAVYELAVWVFVSDDRLFWKFGGSVVHLTPETATWLRRGLAVLLVGLTLSLGLLFHKPFLVREGVLSGEVILGFFYGPLLAVWINSLIAKPSTEAVGAGQYVAGVGLALLFLVGSVGSQTGDLIQEYAKKVSKIAIGGTEVTFDRSPSSDSNLLSGSLPLSGDPTTYASSSGAIGLEYLSQLHMMIDRDIKYLKIFAEIELDKDESRLKHVRRDADRLQMSAEIDDKKMKIAAVLAALDKAELFANETIKRPAACLVGWYSVTGDSGAVNKHLAKLADVFKRLPATESGQPVDELATEFVEVSFGIAADAVSSVPGLWLGDRCDDLLEQFCPKAFSHAKERALNDVGQPVGREKRIRDDSQLIPCIRQPQAAPRADSLPSDLKDHLLSDLTSFVQKRGWEARPYFALGYASILSQLGQNQAASVVLDRWLNTRFTRPDQVWKTATDWFDVRARLILANFLEDWIKKEVSPVPTALRNEHIANLESVRSELRGHLQDIDFFHEIEATLDKQASEPLGERLKEPMSCNSHDAYSDDWRRIFQSYVTGELTYLNALIAHPEYTEHFLERANSVATRLVGMDLSCIPRVPDAPSELVHPIARIFYAQILDAFGENAYRYSAIRWKSESAAVRQQRLSDGLQAVDFGLNLIGTIAQKDRERTGAAFLRRIAPSDAVDTEEKLKTTEKKLRKMRDS